MKRRSIIKLYILPLILLLISLMVINIVQAQGYALIFPTAFKGTREAGPDNRWVTVDLDYASFMANLWNLASGTQGSMRMEFTGKSAEVYGKFSNLPKQVTVQGGPGIRYGRNIWGGNPPAHPLYRIPKKLTELPYAIFFANYTVYEKESTLPITTTLFLWTVKSIRDGGTKAGDVLIIVRVYRHPGWPLTGTILANVTAPLIVNNTLVYAKFAVQAGNLDKSSDTHTSFVFELLTPIRKGRVGIPIPEFISLAATLMPQLAPRVWTREEILNNTLQMIDFTFEWGSNQVGEGEFKWSLYEVGFLVGANVIETVKTVTQATTVTQISTTTLTTTLVQPFTTTVRETVAQTITSTKTEVHTFTTTLIRTETSIERLLTTVTEKEVVKEVDWTITILLGVALLLVGLGIGMMVKIRAPK